MSQIVSLKTLDARIAEHRATWQHCKNKGLLDQAERELLSAKLLEQEVRPLIAAIEEIVGPDKTFGGMVLDTALADRVRILSHAASAEADAGDEARDRAIRLQEVIRHIEGLCQRGEGPNTPVMTEQRKVQEIVTLTRATRLNENF